MGDLTRNFSRIEFACRCGCGYDNINPDLVAALQELRDKVGQALHVNSGCRCEDQRAISLNITLTATKAVEFREPIMIRGEQDADF